MHEESCAVTPVCQNAAWALLLMPRPPPPFDVLKRSQRSNKGSLFGTSIELLGADYYMHAV